MSNSMRTLALVSIASLALVTTVAACGSSDDKAPASPGGAGGTAAAGHATAGNGGSTAHPAGSAPGGGSGGTTATTGGAGGSATTGGSTNGGSTSGGSTSGGTTAGGNGAGGSPTGGSGGAATACAHDLCTVGVALDPTCDPQVAGMCAKDDGIHFYDPYCCDVAWDLNCVETLAAFTNEATCTLLHDQATPPKSNVKATAISDDIQGGCAVDEHGAVWCWGVQAAYADVLKNPAANGHTYVPRKIPGVTNAVEVADGNAGTCALDTNGDVSCWGLFYQASTPVGPTKVLSDVKLLRGRGGPLCAEKNDGTIWCWGSAEAGSGLIPGVSSDAVTPTAVGVGSGAIDVMIGNDQVCAIGSDGSVTCWGGQEPSSGSWQPSATVITNCLPLTWNVIQGNDCKDPVTGAKSGSINDGHSCVVRGDGSVFCVGYDSHGQIDGTPTTLSPAITTGSPTLPATALEVVAGLPAGEDGGTSCALLQGGDVYCWGENELDGAGIPNVGGVAANDISVSKVATISNIAHISGSATGGDDTWFSMLALSADGTVYSWGGSQGPAYTTLGVGALTVTTIAAGQPPTALVLIE